MKKSFVVRLAVAFCLLVMSQADAMAQIFKNGGIFRNTSTTTVRNFQNYTGSGGTVRNSGSINADTTAGGSGGVFDNSNAASVVYNYIGGIANGGTIRVKDFTNGTGLVDNDSADSRPSLKVARNLTSTGTFLSDTGRVYYNGGWNQSILATTYGRLIIADGAAVSKPTKSLAGTVTVIDSAQLLSAYLSTGGNTLQTFGYGFYSANAADSLIGSTGTVSYLSVDSAAFVLPGTYGTLNVTGGNSATYLAKVTSSDLRVRTALNVSSADSLDVQGNLDVNGTFGNNGWIALQGSGTFSSANAGSFLYYAPSAAQTIAASSYQNLYLQGTTSNKTFAGNTTVLNGYDISAMSGGTRDYTTNTVLFTYGGTTVQAPSGQTVVADDYYDLSFANSAAKSFSPGSAQTVNVREINIANGSGLVSIGANGTVNAGYGTLTAGLFTVSGSISNAGTIVASKPVYVSSNVILVNSTGTFANSNSVTSTNGDFTNDGGVVTNTGTITVN